MTKIALTKEETKRKEKYRITNWKSYNKSLVQRGNITLWISEEVIESWNYEGARQKGGQYEYSDSCIECLLGLKVVFMLAYRQLEGFAQSLIKLMGFEVSVPSYSQICRRSKDIAVNILAPKTNQPIFMVVDSTGLKVYGEASGKLGNTG
jgi:hypothetical protein